MICINEGMVSNRGILPELVMEITCGMSAIYESLIKEVGQEGANKVFVEMGKLAVIPANDDARDEEWHEQAHLLNKMLVDEKAKHFGVDLKEIGIDLDELEEMSPDELLGKLKDLID